MLFRSSVNKAKGNAPLGLNFWKTPNASIIIINVDDHGLFAGRGLKVGMHVEKVNDIFVGDQEWGSIATVPDLQEHLAQLSGRITIWASDGRTKTQQVQQLSDHKTRLYSMKMDATPSKLLDDSKSNYADCLDDESDLSGSSGSISESDDDFVDAWLHSFAI